MTAVSARDGGPLPLPAVDESVLPASHRRRNGSGFWAVAFAFLIVTAFATVPSPLYGLYRTRDNLSAFTITVIYAIFAGARQIRRVLGCGIGSEGAYGTKTATARTSLHGCQDQPAR